MRNLDIETFEEIISVIDEAVRDDRDEVSEIEHMLIHTPMHTRWGRELKFQIRKEWFDSYNRGDTGESAIDFLDYLSDWMREQVREGGT